MPKLTPGNRLYLYQLLRDQIGTGRQTLVSRVEEVLTADDLAPEDLGFGSARELLEDLGDMVKVTVFKKGNTYATLLPNPEWDRLLDEPAAPDAQKKAAAKGKPWKHRTKAKALKPAKPRHVRARQEQPAADAHAEADAARNVPEEAAGTASTSAAPGDRAAEAPRAEAAPETHAEDKAPSEGAGVPQATPSPAVEAEQAVRLESLAAGLGDEAKDAPATGSEGQDGPQEAEALPLEQTIEASRPQVPPTHHIKLTVTYDPYAGIERDIAATERNLSEAVLESTRRQAEAAGGTPEPDGKGQPAAQKAQRHEAATPPEAAGREPSARAARQEPSPSAAPSDAAPSPSSGAAKPEAPAQHEPAPSPRMEPKRQAAPEPQPEFELLDEAEEATVAPEPILVGLPRDFAAEVYVPNGPLSLLYQLVSPGDDPNQILAEDWQAARSTRSYAGTRNLVEFPVRLAHRDGSPVTVTMRRTTRPASGRHWAVTAVDGSDGSEPLSEDAGPCGLPETGTAVERQLARSVELGPWDEALTALANVAVPEDWDLPGKKGGHGELRLYLAMTWRAVLEQGLLATTEDGAFAAFDTGLLSPLSEHVFACLEGRGEDAPWKLLGFSTTGEGDLGSQLDELERLPHAPRYLDGFGDLVIAPGTEVDLPRRIARALGEHASELVTASVRLCAADWRLVAPAVDVDSGDRCLLLPLGAAAEPAHVTCALCVERSDDGLLRATGVHDLVRAHAEARVVARSLPGWLERGTSNDATGTTATS